MINLKKLWYKLTAYLPRRLPQTKEEFDQLFMILVTIFGVPDSAKNRYMVASQIGSSKASTPLFKPYASLANACRRLDLNSLMQDQKVVAGEIMKRQTEERAKTLLTVIDGTKPENEPQTNDSTNDVS